MALNKVMLIGNVGRDPEIRHLDNGVAITTIALATSETYTDKNSGQRTTNTEWHNVVLWHQLADLAERYIRKGTQLYVEGKIRTRSWEDRNGQKRSTTEIIADNVQLLGRREDSSAGAQPAATAAPARFSPAAVAATQSASTINDDPNSGNTTP
ncbi:MAG: single-stranded DNA-binding protein [Prevotellaceae bacterium]|jgi:single-strand DNA-binding protein|nr:single-stranded DNA-binding protein [Prevotellaceae bacterium]